MTDKIGNGSIPLRIGNLINATVYGGPYREIPANMFGVKMAVEIKRPCDVDIPTKDFNVPEISDLRAGVVRALMAMTNGQVVYAGCWGGIGRTGLFLAALAKVQIEYRKMKHRPGRGEDPVLYVRKHFLSHAVETDEQQQFIEDFDVVDIVTWLDMTQTAMGLGGLTPAKAHTIEIDLTNQSPVELPTDNYTDPWKRDRREYVISIEDDYYDSADEGNLQTQIFKLEERVATLADSVKVLTKPRIFERIRKWVREH